MPDLGAGTPFDMHGSMGTRVTELPQRRQGSHSHEAGAAMHHLPSGGLLGGGRGL